MFHVDSEAGRLRQAILHRPRLELKRLSPTNHDDYLFDDVLWVKRAKEEHDAFAEALREAGVRVHLLHELLRETVAIPEARKHILEGSFDERMYGPLAADALYAAFADFDDEELVEHLIGGITKREMLDHVAAPSSVVLQSLDPDDLLLPPLPNHLFTRDTSAWIHDGVSINSMRKKARARETVHYEAIYRWHPLFAGGGFNVWSEGTVNGPATTEGGDIHVIGNGAVLVGMSERTTPQGVERLAQRLFGGGTTRRIVALAMPRSRAFMHLDTVMTMVDGGTAPPLPGHHGPGPAHREPAGAPHALPARVPRPAHHGERGALPGDRDDGAGGHRRGLRVTALNRLRPGGEPDAHDQGRARRHAGALRRALPAPQPCQIGSFGPSADGPKGGW